MQALDVCFSWCAIRSHEDQALRMSVLNRRRSSRNPSEEFATVIENEIPPNEETSATSLGSDSQLASKLCGMWQKAN